MGVFDFLRGKSNQATSNSEPGVATSSAPARMLPMDWLAGKRNYRTTTPRQPSLSESARGPRTSASFTEVKFHVGQDLVAACIARDEQVVTKVRRVYSMSASEWAALVKKIEANDDIEAEVDTVANRIYWEGRG